MIRAFHFISSLITHITFSVSHLHTDADKQPADSFTKVAALDIDNLLIKTPDISKGILFNIEQALLKEWGPGSLGILLEEIMQELVTGVTFNFFQFFSIPHYPCSPIFILILTCPIIVILSILFLFLYFQGLNLLELAAHLEKKAAQLRCEGLGWIKIALASTDTSSLLEILQGHFGHIDSSESADSANESEKGLTTEEKTPKIAEKTSTTSPEASWWATAELVFPFKSTPLVVAGIPKTFLPFHGPEALSSYQCQVPSCILEFSQKAVPCNHVHHDHLNIALVWLYCIFENNPKMWWYITSASEHNSLKHLKENLPIHPDDSTFSQQFSGIPGDDVIPCTSKENVPHKEEIRKWAEAAKQYFEEEQDLEVSQTSLPCSNTEGLKLSSLETSALKHCIKQGLTKSHNKLKLKTTDDLK